MNKYIKFIVLLFINYIPLIFYCSFYKAGIGLSFSTLLYTVVINYINYKYSDNILLYIFLSLNLYISVLVGEWSENKLYYNNISSDNDTIAVGKLFIYIFKIYILGMTSITLPIYKLMKERKH